MAITGLGFIGAILKAIFGALGAIFQPIFDILFGLLELLFADLLYFIPQFIYGLFVGLSSIVDFVQGLFKQLAGIGEYKVAGQQGVQQGDIVSYILGSSAIQNVFYALVIVSILLIVIFTIVQIIRNTYGGADKDATAFTIIGRGLKACLFFFFIPVVCIMGLQLSAGVFRTLDEATGGSSTAAISNQVMVSGLYNANRVREGSKYKNEKPSDYFAYRVDSKGITDKSKKITFTSTDSDGTVADKIDMVFRLNYEIYKGNDHVGGGTLANNILNKESTVSAFYNLGKANWIIIAIGLVLTLTVFMNFVFGLIQRIFELVALFILSPISLAFAPMDDLAGFKTKFITPFYKKAISAYAVLLSLNLFFVILPYFQKIELFWNTSASSGTFSAGQFYNFLTQTFFVLGALSLLPGLRDTIVNFLGADKLTEKAPGAVLKDGVKPLTDMGGKIGKGMKGIANFRAATKEGGVKGAFAHMGKGATDRIMGKDFREGIKANSSRSVSDAAKKIRKERVEGAEGKAEFRDSNARGDFRFRKGNNRFEVSDAGLEKKLSLLEDKGAIDPRAKQKAAWKAQDATRRQDTADDLQTEIDNSSGLKKKALQAKMGMSKAGHFVGDKVEALGEGIGNLAGNTVGKVAGKVGSKLGVGSGHASSDALGLTSTERRVLTRNQQAMADAKKYQEGFDLDIQLANQAEVKLKMEILEQAGGAATDSKEYKALKKQESDLTGVISKLNTIKANAEKAARTAGMNEEQMAAAVKKAFASEQAKFLHEDADRKKTIEKILKDETEAASKKQMTKLAEELAKIKK